MKPDKSPGPDQIHPQLLKVREGSSTMAIPLTIIFQESMSKGQVSKSWKDAKVTPIIKKGKKKSKSNVTRDQSVVPLLCVRSWRR